VAGGKLDEEQEVDPSAEHGVDREKVTRQQHAGLGSQELLPGGSGPAGRRVDAGPVQDLPALAAIR
jgi:hypothetical protein